MKRYLFTATIQAATVGSGGAYVLFPYDVEREFGATGRVAVQAIFDGVRYTGTLMQYGQPQHMLCVLKSVRARIGKGPGDSVDVVLWKDEAVRTLKVPSDFAELLKTKSLRPAFDALSLTHRKEYCRWITEAKKEETRARRLAKAMDMLSAGIKTPG